MPSKIFFVWLYGSGNFRGNMGIGSSWNKFRIFRWVCKTMKEFDSQLLMKSVVLVTDQVN